MALLPSQSVVFSIFFSGAHPQNASQLFVQAFDVEPEQTQHNKNGVIAGSPYISVAAGPFKSELAKIQIGHGRIDIGLDPFISDDVKFEQMGIIPTDEGLNLLLGSVRRLIAESPNIIRLAVNTSLIQENVSSDASVKSIFSDMGIKYPEVGLNDVSVQLNKRLKLANGISINRLLRYNVAVFQRMFFNGTEAIPISGEKFAKVLNLDLNTVVDGTKFDAETAITTFQLIIDETLRIASVGNASAILD